jgi:hypothetical protein
MGQGDRVGRVDTAVARQGRVTAKGVEDGVGAVPGGWPLHGLEFPAVAGQIADYQRSGFEVAGVVGVDASPTCGVATTLDLGASLDAILGCPLTRLDRRFMNDTVVGGAARAGKGPQGPVNGPVAAAGQDLRP